jgi:hypothetical protein
MRTKARAALLVCLVTALTLAGGATSALLGSCGPFSDVSGLVCGAVLKMYFLGVTAGTSPTTFSENDTVTRGQMALFLARTHDQIKRTENPVRLAQGLINQPSNYEYFEDFKDPLLTGHPNGFATDGLYDYVASQDTTKIGIYASANGLKIGSFTTGTTNNRMVCDGVYLYITSNYGTTLKRIQLRTATVADPWGVALPAGTGDICFALDNVAVATNSGISIENTFSNSVTNVDLGGGTFGVVFDGAYLWATGGPTADLLFKIDISGNIQPGYPVTLDGPVNYYMGNDGQNLWIPIKIGGTSPAIEIVGMRQQAGQKVDLLGAPLSKAKDVEGIAYNGRYMVAAWIADFGCGNPPTGAVPIFYDAASHARLPTGYFSCFEPDAFTIGFNGYGFRWLGYSAAGSIRPM